MDRNKPVMETHCQFIGLVTAMFDPVARVVNSLSEVWLYLKGLDAEIAFRRAVLSRPSPDLIEHAAMQAPQESLSENIVPTVEGPAVRCANVLLFEFVQLAPGGIAATDGSNPPSPR